MPCDLRYPMLIFISFILVLNPISGQDKPTSVKVFASDRHNFQFPWAGGMNSCQFYKLDIDLDGLKDLIVFDRTGDRIMPFLTVQSGEIFDYEYAPEYAEYFPQLSHWAIFTDYDGDGKEDIFTYSPGYAGLKVYRNISLTHLDFRLEVYPFLTSFQGGGYVNILVTYADYPAICDLDGDGDLDILTFWGLGSFVEKHRNMSMEKYGKRDSLDFMKTDFCWGYFAESDESNLITLDTCLRCESGEAWEHGSLELGTANWELRTGNWELGTANREERHTGSTFRLLELNGDNLIDLLLGDVDYPNLVALYNGGNADTARMVSFDWQYPTDGVPINLFSMPAAFYDDFDNDGINDLLVAPFDPNPFLSNNFQSAWFYHNDGSNDQPQFNLKSRSFLQDQMIDVGAGAYPVFWDIDQDGLTDLLIGNYGYYDTSYYDQFMTLHTEHTSQVAWLRNTGTTEQPAFTFMDRDFAGVSSLDLKGLAPAFGDLDGDNDVDMLLGCEDGTIIYYLNTASPGEPMSLALSQLNFQDIDVGAFSTPQLFDLDRDNLSDLIIGEKGGNINFYKNTGTMQNPGFTLVTDSLGKVNVIDYSISLDGFSVPFFYRDAQDQTHLLVGSEKGDVLYFTGIDGNLEGEFTLSDTLAGLIGLQEFKADRGYRSAPALFDLDQNGYPELIAGNFSGGLEYFAGSGFPPVSGLDEDSLSIPEVIIYPVPATDQINISVADPDTWRIIGVKIISADGRVVLSYNYDNEIKMIVNTNFFTKGLFICQIKLKDMHTGRIHLFCKILI
ncbi:MAG: T9SS type A sorting domain-containing protein [Bacteroidales bacterium]|nr:T9SS type A sorting domain-containing protein [Bacteroidales bacterium]